MLKLLLASALLKPGATNPRVEEYLLKTISMDSLKWMKMDIRGNGLWAKIKMTEKMDYGSVSVNQLNTVDVQSFDFKLGGLFEEPKYPFLYFSTGNHSAV